MVTKTNEITLWDLRYIGGKYSNLQSTYPYSQIIILIMYIPSRLRCLLIISGSIELVVKLTKDTSTLPSRGGNESKY